MRLYTWDDEKIIFIVILTVKKDGNVTKLFCFRKNTFKIKSYPFPSFHKCLISQVGKDSEKNGGMAGEYIYT